MRTHLDATHSVLPTLHSDGIWIDDKAVAPHWLLLDEARPASAEKSVAANDDLLAALRDTLLQYENPDTYLRVLPSVLSRFIRVSRSTYTASLPYNA